MERLLDLKSPPKPGETYLVPSVRFLSLKDWAPVIGPCHNDKEIKAAEVDHFHLDVRFISDEELIMKYGFESGVVSVGQYDSYSPTVFAYSTGGLDYQVEDKPFLCLRDNFPTHRNFRAGRFGYLSAEVRCIREKKGITHLNMNCKVCPHKGARLDNIPVKDGVIKCPLHGMEFDGVTGEIIQF